MTLVKLVMCAAVVAVLGAARPSAAATLRTPAMQAGSGEMLVCTVTNVAGKPIGITAQLSDHWGRNVTCFLGTEWDDSNTVLLTLHAEATDPKARYCKVTVTGGRRSDVAAAIQACTYDLSACSDPVVAR